MISVVLVEDSAIIRERLAALLRAEGGLQIVGEFADAPSAVAGIRQVMPKAVVLDIELGATSGLDVLGYIRQYLPDLKVIVLSNYAGPQYRAYYLAAGADEVLDKSNEFNRVPQLLRSYAEHTPS